MDDLKGIASELKSRMTLHTGAAGDAGGNGSSRQDMPGRCLPDCEICGGLGVVRYAVPLEDFRFGRLFPCPSAPLEMLHTEGHFGLYWDEQRSLSWDSVLEINGAGRALSAVRQALGYGHGWVYLWGPFGTAKTLLLKTAVAETLRLPLHAVYIRMVDLMDDLRASYDQDKAGTLLIQRVAHYTALPLLALDEIDRVKQSEWVKERLFQILDRRYDTALLKRSVTLIASNKGPDEHDGYLSSRLRDGRFEIVHLDGVDLRPGMGGAC